MGALALPPFFLASLAFLRLCSRTFLRILYFWCSDRRLLLLFLLFFGMVTQPGLRAGLACAGRCHVTPASRAHRTAGKHRTQLYVLPNVVVPGAAPHWAACLLDDDW